MFKQFIEILKDEIKVLEEILFHSEKQYNDLKNYKVTNVEQNSLNLERTLRKLNTLENQRIVFFMNWFKISKKEAMMLKLSTLEKNLKGQTLELVVALKNQMNDLNAKINYFNRHNKILTNRAKYSVNNIMKLLSNSHKTVFNVKV